jgi:Polyketide cyclase / dehydrase and lipid transport
MATTRPETTAAVVSAEVDQPAEVVFAYATDPTHFAERQEGVVNGRMDRPGPPTVGARCHTTRRIGGSERQSTSEVVRSEPPHTWSVRGLDGPIRAAVDVTVEPLSDRRSQITIAVDFDGHGVGRLLVPLVVRRQARKEMPSNIARLKQRLEPAARHQE